MSAAAAVDSAGGCSSRSGSGSNAVGGDGVPHHAVSFAASTPSGAVPPSPASSNGASASPLQLPPHPTTPSSGSGDAALEAAAGINRTKLTPADVLFGRTLGEGSFAKVVAATLRADASSASASSSGDAQAKPQQYAVKIVDKAFVTKMGKIHTVINEKKIMALLHEHPGIVKLKYTFQDSVSLYYMMELAEGGELFTDLKSVGKYSLELARFYAAQLVEILAFLHLPPRRVIHRDLKPENILLSAGRHLRLTDFGTARQLTPADEAALAADAAAAASGGKKAPKRRGSFVGTAEYVCPEILRDEMPGTSADLWSLGCVLFQMLTGRVPFKGASEYLTFQKILKRRLHFPPEMDPSARDLIERLLMIDPSARLGAAGTHEAYEQLRAHPFFAGHIAQWGDALFAAPVPPRPEPSAVLAEPAGATDEPPSPMLGGDDDDDDDEADDGAGNGSDDEWEARMAALGVAQPSGADAQPAAASGSSALGEVQELGGEADESGDGLAPLPSSAAGAAASSSAAAAAPAAAPAHSSSVPHGPTVAEKIASAGGSGPSASTHAPLSSRVGVGGGPIHRADSRLSTDGQYFNSVWSKFLRQGERILYAGLVMKRRSVFARKRQLLLTSLPRLFYVDPEKMELKKEIPWTERLWAEVRDPQTFWIHTPNRDYYMRGISASSYAWCNEINGLQLQLKAQRNDG